MSGHSKWATIKHKKGAADAKRGKLFTKLIKEITVAARMGGGDPGGNPRLRKAISDAKGQAMPNDTIKRAVQRGTGELEGASYEEILYEGTGPGGTLFLCEAMTDNKNRTVAEIRKVFEKNNGALGAGGSAQWAFERKGIVAIAKDGATEDQLMEVAVGARTAAHTAPRGAGAGALGPSPRPALAPPPTAGAPAPPLLVGGGGAGAHDYSDQGDDWQVLTAPTALDPVLKALEDAKIAVKESSLGYVPKNKKPVSGRDAEVCLNLADALDDHDDVQNVFADFDVSDEEMARIAG